MKYAEEIVKELNKRGEITIPSNCVADDSFDKWIHKEQTDGKRG